MAEELRFFLRTALYSALIAVVYWFASYDPVRDRYDWAGTAMLVAAALAAAAVVAVLAGTVRNARSPEPRASGSPLRIVDRVVGFADPGGAADDRPLAAGLDPVPTGSAWPIAAGIAGVLIGLGLVYGPWLWLPGLVLMGVTAWAWVTELG